MTVQRILWQGSSEGKPVSATLRNSRLPYKLPSGILWWSRNKTAAEEVKCSMTQASSEKRFHGAFYLTGHFSGLFTGLRIGENIEQREGEERPGSLYGRTQQEWTPLGKHFPGLGVPQQSHCAVRSQCLISPCQLPVPFKVALSSRLSQIHRVAPILYQAKKGPSTQGLCNGEFTPGCLRYKKQRTQSA